MTTLTIENVDEQFIAFAELAQKTGANLRFEQKDHLPQLLYPKRLPNWKIWKKIHKITRITKP